jgi:hypothetical protein
MARLCISIPAHEELTVVFDQINNIRAFLPADTVIVFHFAQGFSSPEWITPMLPEGVYVNPVSLPTAWGNVIDQHNANFRFIAQREQFDYFVIHASNDLYIRKGVERYVETAEAGFQRNQLHPYIERCTPEGPPTVPEPRVIACSHQDLQDMVRHLGLDGVTHTQIEGIFFQRELMAKVVDVIDRFWHPGPTALIAPEHFYYPTAASAFTGDIAMQVVYSFAHYEDVRTPISPVFVRRLRKGTYSEDPGQEWADKVGGTPADHRFMVQYDFESVYAVKRVERRYDDQTRRYIRALAREEAEPVRLPRPDGYRGFNALAFADEVVEKPWILETYAREFTARDDIALAVWLPSEQVDALTGPIEQSIEDAGLMDDSAAQVVAMVLPDTDDTRILLGGTCDVACTDRPLTGVLEDLLPVPSKATDRLTVLRQYPRH